jgi:hypothetical protein
VNPVSRNDACWNGDLDITDRAHLPHQAAWCVVLSTTLLGHGEFDSSEQPPGTNRELAMPTRKRTRAEDRAYRVQRERALNRARYAADPPPF